MNDESEVLYIHQMACICSGRAGSLSAIRVFDKLDGGGGANFSIDGPLEMLLKVCFQCRFFRHVAF